MHIFKKKFAEKKLIFEFNKYLNESKTAYTVFDHNHYPIFWNKAAENILGSYFKDKIKLEEFLYKNTVQLGSEKAENFYKNFVLDGSFEFEFKRTDKNLNNIILQFTAMKQKDGNYFVIIEDYPANNAILNTLHNSGSILNTRNLFIANVSHEIRTPIQTIIGTMELINETELNEEQREYTRQVNFSAEVLLALVNDILDFSKLENGNIVLENSAFNLINAVEQIADLVSMEAHKKGLEILVDIDTNLPEFIMGDVHRLQQVLLNLSKNAVKFTEDGGVIISVKLQNNTQDTYILFEVSDTGIGVKPEHKAKIFDSFYQGSSAINRKYGGTGLGLAISKNIVNMMNGEIGIRDNFEKGSVFWFKIPVNKANKKSPKENILLSKTTRFLIVDDNLLAGSVFKRMLYKLGFQDITVVTGGKQAIEIMKAAMQANNPFDMAFIDMIMPEMDGWRLAAELHNNASLKKTKLYLMIPEGRLGGDAKMKLLKWFNGYLYKPLKRNIVLNYLNDIYRKSELNTDEVAELEPIEFTDNNTAKKTETNLKTNFNGVTVLVVDDHSVNRQILKLLLEKAGCIVKDAEDGLEAIEILNTDVFDIVFMDIQMPGLNGYETVKILRKKGYTKPVIACTAGSQENEKQLCISFGMNDIITKPFNKTQLFEMIQKYIQ